MSKSDVAHALRPVAAESYVKTEPFFALELDLLGVDGVRTVIQILNSEAHFSSRKGVLQVIRLKGQPSLGALK